MKPQIRMIVIIVAFAIVGGVLFYPKSRDNLGVVTLFPPDIPAPQSTTSDPTNVSSPCSSTMRQGDVVEEGPIAHDFNGSDFPNKYRVVNGPQYWINCYDTQGQAVFQQQVLLDRKDGTWQNLYIGPDSVSVTAITGIKGVATSTISVLPRGRYVSFSEYAWEWLEFKMVDIEINRNVARETFSQESQINSVPDVSPSGKTIVYTSYNYALDGSGWPGLWLVTNLDPLRVKRIYSYPQQDSQEPFPPFIQNVRVTDSSIVFDLASTDYPTQTLGSYEYTISTGKLHEVN